MFAGGEASGSTLSCHGERDSSVDLLPSLSDYSPLVAQANNDGEMARDSFDTLRRLYQPSNDSRE